MALTPTGIFMSIVTLLSADTVLLLAWMRLAEKLVGM